MGTLFDQPDDEMAVCDLAATLRISAGMTVRACYLKALNVDGRLLSHISLVEKN